MKDDYRILLNFLPVVGTLPSFRVYRRPRAAAEPRPDESTAAYSLFSGATGGERATYWVKGEPAEGYVEYLAAPEENHDLTRWALCRALQDAARQTLQSDQYVIDEGRFLREVALVMRTHPEGEERLLIQPYTLRATNQVGCLADYHFHLKAGVPFSRRVQQLSLSLDRHFKRNLDCYLDRDAKVRSSLKERAALFSALRLPGTSVAVRLSAELVSLPARRLRSKVYIFANNRDSKSQFAGLRDYGPLQPLAAPPNLLFLFREQDRVAARTLATALRGAKGKETVNFPGFQALFKTELQIDAQPVVLRDLGAAAMADALGEVEARRATAPNTLPVLVLPEGGDNGYLAHKAGFAHAGIPTQVCTLRVIQDPNALKWAIANIALQVFCKAGGQPWKVRPTAEPTLVIGVSQSHKIRETGEARHVEKYFAFTVMTDNSGLFQKIQVLGEGGDKAEYLRQLRENLRVILAEASQRFNRVVVHTSFKLRREEMDAIQKSVTEAAGQQGGNPCRFAVVKVNHKCRFFGVNPQVNSLVPYEGTAVKLGFREYLVWFEGIFPDKPTVTRA
jgi:hypothetical protein